MRRNTKHAKETNRMKGMHKKRINKQASQARIKQLASKNRSLTQNLQHTEQHNAKHPQTHATVYKALVSELGKGVGLGFEGGGVRRISFNDNLKTGKSTSPVYVFLCRIHLSFQTSTL